MKQRWLDLKVAVREFLSPTWSHEDEPDRTTSDQIARWVGSHRHPDGR